MHRSNSMSSQPPDPESKPTESEGWAQSDTKESEGWAQSDSKVNCFSLDVCLAPTIKVKFVPIFVDCEVMHASSVMLVSTLHLISGIVLRSFQIWKPFQVIFLRVLASLWPSS